MARYVVLFCLALVACVAAAPGPNRVRRYYDGGLNLGGYGGGGGGFGGYGGHGGQGGHGGLNYGLGPHTNSQSYSKSSASSSSVSGGVGLG